MRTVKLNVPEYLVARVDRALKREGLDVRERVFNAPTSPPGDCILTVVPGAPLPEVPRVIAHDGPAPRRAA